MAKKANFAKIALMDLPASDLWRLFIDGFRQDEGQFAFDKGFGAEGGYYASMISAWKTMIEHVNEPLTVQSFSDLHESSTGKLAYYDTEEGNIMREKKHAPHEFSLLSQDTTLDRFAWNCTFEGIKEFVQYYQDNHAELKENNQSYAFGVKNAQGFTYDYDLMRTDKTVTEIAHDLNELAKRGDVSFGARGDSKLGAELIINKYYQNIAQAKTDDAKLAVIAQCVGELERLHAFQDANCRTMILTLNKLLIQNELYPTILENPNRMDLLSNAELVAQIKQGQAQFKLMGVSNLVKKIETLRYSPTTETNYQNQLREQLSPDPLQALSQLNTIFERLKEGKLHIPSAFTSRANVFSPIAKSLGSKSVEKKALKDVLQKLYAEKFNEAVVKMDNLKAKRDIYQKEYTKLDEISNRTVDQQDKFEKAYILTKRIPTAIEWMEGTLADITNKHKRIINHIPINQNKSELKQVIEKRIARIPLPAPKTSSKKAN